MRSTFVTLLCLLPITVPAAVINVPADRSTIQDAINGALMGDTVIVAPGVYSGEGNRDLDFNGKRIIVRSSDGPEITIIHCEGTLDQPHRGFVFHKGEDTTAKVEGFTIRQGFGHADGPGGTVVGGAIRCDSSSKPIISNCILRENFAQVGGAVYVSYSSYPWMRDCIVRRNQASYGAGAAFYRAYCAISSCIVDSNVADSGAGIAGHRVLGGIVNTEISSNVAQIYGGGIAMDSVSLWVDSCRFTANLARFEGSAWLTSSGGAIRLMNAAYYYNLYLDPYYSSIVSHSAFEGDSAGGGGAISSDGHSNLTILACQFRHNYAFSTGGAVAINGGLIDSCTFESNRAGSDDFGQGGAIVMSIETTAVTDCSFNGNWALYYGGAIFVTYEGFAQVSNCTFSNNEAQMFGGGAISCHNNTASALVDSCVFHSNRGITIDMSSNGEMKLSRSTLFGGTPLGVFSSHVIVYPYANLQLSHVILAFGSSGPSISCYKPYPGAPDPYLQIDNCDFYGNPGGNWAECIAGFAGSNDNFSANPAFCDTLNHDLSFTSASVCAQANRPDNMQVGSLGVGCSCCFGTTGNVDLEGGVNTLDLVYLIQYLTPPLGPELGCIEEVNVNGEAGINSLDLAYLIAYLTPPTGPELPSCP